MTSPPPATSTSVTIALTKGTRMSRDPSAERTASRSWPGCSTSVTTPTTVPSAVLTDSPISSWSRNSSGSSGEASVPESTISQVPRNSAAASRSLMPVNLTMSSPDCQRAAATVSVPMSARSVSSREPAANLRSGSSVRTPTTTSPRIPCGRPIRPTVTCMDPSANLAGLQQVDADMPVPGERTDHGTQRPGGAPAPADDLSEVVWVHANLKDVAAAEHPAGHADIVRVRHDPPDQVLEGLLKHVRLRYHRRRPRQPGPQAPQRRRRQP